MKPGCGAMLLSPWGLKFHLARRSPPLIAEHRPILYVKHGGGFGAAAPLDDILNNHPRIPLKDPKTTLE